MKTTDDPIPSWFFLAIWIFTAAAFCWLSNEDYQWERALECSRQGLYHNRNTDTCERKPRA